VSAVEWVDRRLRLAEASRPYLRKVFPSHWSFLLGEIALYAFVVLVATGVFLALLFEPSQAETVYAGAYEPLRGLELSRAYVSTLDITFDVPAGLLIRQTHHWAALVFVAAIVAHLLRVFFTGAFRRPRELNWIVGVTLLALALLSGFSGYSLPDDLLSGTGLRIAWSSALGVPLLGDELAFLLFGGEYPGDIIPRLFVLHVLLVPAALAALIGLHLAMIVRQRHTQLPGAGRSEEQVVGERLWPRYALTSLALLCAVAAVLVALGAFVQINPVWLYGPYQPFAVSSPAQPDWYLMWVEGALRVFPPWKIDLFGVTVPSQFIPGVLLPGATFAVLYAWPFLEARATGDRDAHELLDRPRDHPMRSTIGIAATTFFVLLLAAAANDHIARLLGVPVLDVTRALRVVLVAAPILAGLATHRVLRALRASGAPTVLDVPAGALAHPGAVGAQERGNAQSGGAARP
jgi:ubiquinol-cytochrome c reductase cytochrome b subunit